MKETITTQGSVHITPTYKLWNIPTSHELFYDPLQKRVIVLQADNVYAFEIHNKNADPVYFKLPIKHDHPEGLAISKDDKYIALQIDILRIGFINFGVEKEVRQLSIKFGSSKIQILTFSFLKAKCFDLVVSFNKCIEIFKYDPEKVRLGKPLKRISHNILTTWIDPLEGVVAASSSDTYGEIHLYNLQRDEDTLRIKTSRLYLFTNQIEEQKGATHLEVPQLLTRNIKTHCRIVEYIEKKASDNFQLHKLFLTKLYSNNILLHYDVTKSFIQLYKLNFDFLKMPAIIKLDTSSQFYIQIADNLLFISDLKDKVTYAYDTKSKHKLDIALFKDIQVDLSYANSYGAENIEDLKENKMDVIKSFTDYKSDHDEVYLNVKCSITDALEVEEEVKDEIFEIKDLIYVDSDLAYNSKTRCFYNYCLNKKKYFYELPKKELSNAMGIIMRRYNSKPFTLDIIRKLIEERVSLEKLYEVYRTINKLLIQPKNNPSKPQSHEVNRITHIVPLIEDTKGEANIYKSQIEEVIANYDVSYL